tara:strand:- start:126 stop:452 length:327 start_codon:yes stop_codon:yes gene_type:complete
MAKKLNNLNFIATYIFEHPGCSASEVRRALYFFKNSILDEGFSEKKSYVSYFQTSKDSTTNRGYAGKYWEKINRTRWVITDKGLEKIDKKLIKKVRIINKKVCSKPKK